MGNHRNLLEEFKAIFEDFTNLPKEEQKTIVLQWIVTFLACMAVCVILVGAFLRPFAKLIGGMNTGIIYLGLVSDLGRFCSFGLGILLFVLIVFFQTRRNVSNRIYTTDERGVHFMEKGTAGTSRWMNANEAKKEFTVGDIYNVTETIYGMFDDRGSKVVGYKKPEKASGNQNRMIFGSPGTGKSYAYGTTELCQAIRRGDSFGTTDPSGEHCRRLAPLAKAKGYTVWILNLVDPIHSSFWNCVNETINHQTGRIDGTKLNNFAEIYMKNSSDLSAKQDQFWVAAGTNLLKAAIGHASWIREEYILSSYRELYKKISKKSKERDIILERKMVGMVSFKWCEERIRKTAEEFGYDLAEIDEIIKSINKNAPRFSITEVFHDLMNFKKIAPEFDLMPINHPGRMAYQIYATNTSEAVQSSALQGIQLRMQLFTDENLTNMLSHDEIDISQINRQKTAVFVILSDKSATTKPIASLFFSFFFEGLMSSWDAQQDISDGTGEENSCLPVTVMLDEFYSIGVIGGSPDTFTTVMSNSRKRQLHISIIIQAWAQVPALYGEANSKTILTCCDTILFLGANDPETCKLISDFAAGISTVLSERHKEDQSMLGPLRSQFDDVQHTTTSRPLLTPDEVKRWKDKMLVSQRGCLPLELKIFPYTLHPYYLNGQIVKRSMDSIVESCEDRILKMEEEASDGKKNTQLMISSLKSQNDIDEEKDLKKTHEQITLDVGEDETEKPKKKRSSSRGTSKGRKKNTAESNPSEDTDESNVSNLF